MVGLKACACCAGARPYHRAYERGVKVIGATAHYATSELDAGPIIEQACCCAPHALPGMHGSPHARLGVSGGHATHAPPTARCRAQDVTRISHRDSVADMIRKGRDLERLVLARALRAVLSDRVMVNGNRTVVFED